MATQYGFFGDKGSAFLKRFDPENFSKDNKRLATDISWNGDPQDKAQKLQDELKNICKDLEKNGCSFAKATRGKQPKGQSPWEQAFRWLWDIKFPEWQQEQNSGNLTGIEYYLEREIRPKPDENIFDETEITFRDLYVPLKVNLLDESGNLIKEQDSIELEEWVKNILDDKQKEKKVLFIQGDAGRGKSVFCRMFADWFRSNLHPKLTPIIIKLRYIKVLENNLTKTLENYLEACEFVRGNPSWLSDKNTRFLFFLDGFDELLLEGRASGGIKEFLQQVEQFQQSSHHRFLVTGRPLALQGIDRLIAQTKSLTRAEIQLMDYSIRQTWLKKWAAKVGEEEANNFQQFLESCPPDVKDNLAREPLLLYLLARMHKEKYLNVQMFAEAEGIKAKIRIYDKSVSWVLEKQRENENKRLTGLDEHYLRQALGEAALCVVQSGNESAPVTMLQSRLEDNNNPIAELIQKARRATSIEDEERFFNNLLTSFYIKPASGDKDGSIEFAHKSFGEFLFAERLKESILDWTDIRKTRHQREEYLISKNEMNKQIYDLLGYGNLTPEIVDYLMALLTEDKIFQPIKLFERLEEFYFSWCEGEFIDAAPSENLPQLKMQMLKTQLPDREPQLGLRQVDMYVGLNVLILLLKLHCYAKDEENLRERILFHPCGKEDSFDKERLLLVIGYSYCISTTAFIEITRFFLNRANLSDANLSDTDLSDANLSGAKIGKNPQIDKKWHLVWRIVNHRASDADLRYADLSGVNLSYVDLSDADLSDADLSYADLRDADLSYANLSSASLINADLINADLRRADLSGAYLINADLSNSNLSNANLRGANLSGAIVKNALFGRVEGLTEDMKYNLEQRGAIFDDRPPVHTSH
ncbi:hypothetical protein NUACC21_48660 [Scytonema sp. NUACC21]